MRWTKILKRIFAVSLTFCLFSVSVFTNSTVLANNNNAYDSMSREEKQIYLEQQLGEVNAKLKELGKESGETGAYLDALDQKVAFLVKQLNIIKDKVENAEEKIVSMHKQRAKNEEDIKNISVQILETEKKIEDLSAIFNTNLDAYYKRLRAMYISGETSIISFLFTSDDIGQLLTRYEMVSRVVKQDHELLQTIQNESTQMNEAKMALSDKQSSLSQKQTDLAKTEKDLTAMIKDLEKDRSEMEEKELILEDQQTQANALLKKLNDQTKEYTEYRDITQSDLDEIDEQIAAAAEKYKTTTTTTTTTTTRAATSNEDITDENNSTLTTTTSRIPTTASSTIRLTYPIPSQTKITTHFNGYPGHSGCDFSCQTGSRVVAAESGTVIISTDLRDDNGKYKSYGRYIVIAHDKKTASDDMVYTLYAHNSTREVSAGQHVTKGQLIAYSGSTGNSTGPHLHFEVRTPGSSYSNCVNPANYLP